MKDLRHIALPGLVAAVPILFLCLSSGATHGQAASEGDRPVRPEPLYEQLHVLMADGMMPNYKAVWSAYRRDDRETMRRALVNIADVAGRLDKYVPPKNATSLDHYRQHMDEVRDKSAVLSAGVTRADRAAVSAGVLSIYKSCQSCHDDYAPADREEARKYAPPA